MTTLFFRGARLLALPLLFSMTACGSSDGDGGGRFPGSTGGSGATNTGGGGALNTGGSGGTNTSGSGARCRLAMTVSGAATFTSSLDDPMSCITAYTLSPGAYVGYGSGNMGDVSTVTLSFPELQPGQPASAIQLPVGINHVDGTEFSPMGCVADVTENAFSETTDAGDVYRVGGEGSCSVPGVVGDRSISVVGFFRFVAPIRWQN